jgi:hypothetical protein
VYMYPEDPTRLYRKQVFTKATLTAMVTPENKPNPIVGLANNQSLFCLAVALLELTYGKPLSEFQEPMTNADERVLQLMTAKRLTKTIREHEEERFASVVINCMNPRSSSPTEYDFSFGNESFRRQFIREILTPLYQDMMALQR